LGKQFLKIKMIKIIKVEINNMKTANKLIMVFIATLFVINVFASEPAPLRVVRTTTTRMMSALRANKSKLKNRFFIRKIVRRIVLPKMDLNAISRSVVGRRFWYQSSQKERNQFIIEFTKYVTDMYSSALSSYSNEKIVFRPVRSFNASMRRVRIYSMLNRPGAPAVELNYRLVKRSNGWKIYDFSVDGVSMVQSYHSQFVSTLNRGGLSLLIRKLRSRN